MMKESHWRQPIHRPGDDPKERDPESHLSSDLLAAIDEVSSRSSETRLQIVESFVADYEERLGEDVDNVEVATKLGELLTYKKDLQEGRIDKAA